MIIFGQNLSKLHKCLNVMQFVQSYQVAAKGLTCMARTVPLTCFQK